MYYPFLSAHPNTLTFAQCSWKREDDARRPATKQLVESLRIKIQVLEEEVARLQAQNEEDLAGPSHIPGSRAFDSSNLSSSSSTLVPSGTGERPSLSLLSSVSPDIS